MIHPRVLLLAAVQLVVTPLATAGTDPIQAAIDAATPGATITVPTDVRGPLEIDVSGAPGRPITIVGAPGAIVRGAGAGGSAILIGDGKHDIVIADLSVTGGRDAAIEVEPETARIHLRRVATQHNGRSGVRLFGTKAFRLFRVNAYANVAGIEVYGRSSGVISQSRVHDNRRMIVKTRGDNDDYGAFGVALLQTVGPIAIRDNAIGGNRARSFDFGIDGSGIEIFGASRTVSRATA